MTSAQHAERDATEHLLEHIALGLLATGAGHGYELYQDYVEDFGAVWQAGRSKFYATLAALQEAGYLDADLELQENRPPRKVYRLTAAGQDALERWLVEPVQAPRHVRVAIPVKLRLFEMLELAGADQLLDAQIATCQARLEREMAQAAATEAPSDLFADLLHDLRRRQLQAMIDWLSHCKTRLKP